MRYLYKIPARQMAGGTATGYYNDFSLSRPFQHHSEEDCEMELIIKIASP